MWPAMRNETLTCEGCIRPNNLGPLCYERSIGDEPCEQKVTVDELNQVSFPEICAWCKGLCCPSGVHFRDLISDDYLVSHGISCQIQRPCAARGEKGCLLPREARPRPCLMSGCAFTRFIAVNSTMWQYCQTNARIIGLDKVVCGECPTWDECELDLAVRQKKP